MKIKKFEDLECWGQAVNTRQLVDGILRYLNQHKRFKQTQQAQQT